MSETSDCFEKGLLKKTGKSTSMAIQDLERADFFLNESFDLLEIKKKEMASIAMYNAVFHAARALLFKDGVREKSHYCLQKYLEENYGKNGQLTGGDLSLFDLLRGIRQETQYNVAKVNFEENLSELYNRAEEFIEKAKGIVVPKK